MCSYEVLMNLNKATTIWLQMVASRCNCHNHSSYLEKDAANLDVKYLLRPSVDHLRLFGSFSTLSFSMDIVLHSTYISSILSHYELL